MVECPLLEYDAERVAGSYCEKVILAYAGKVFLFANDDIAAQSELTVERLTWKISSGCSSKTESFSMQRVLTSFTQDFATVQAS